MESRTKLDMPKTQKFSGECRIRTGHLFPESFRGRQALTAQSTIRGNGDFFFLLSLVLCYVQIVGQGNALRILEPSRLLWMCKWKIRNYAPIIFSPNFQCTQHKIC